MIQVKFLTQDNKIYELNYSDVLEFCKSICLSEKNIKAFLEFRKDYTIFEPFFDFVTFKLKYIFCMGNLTLVYYKSPKTKEEALYESAISSLNYEEIMFVVQEMFNLQIDDFPVLKIVRCSDYELNINIINGVPKSSFLIDNNLIGYISKIGDANGSHLVTANTILNQYLIQDGEILKSLINYKNINNLNDGIALNYLVDVLGFIRITKYALVYNGIAVSQKQRQFIKKAEEADDIVEDKDVDIDYAKIKK